jgi:hypothetical protein
MLDKTQRIRKSVLLIGRFWPGGNPSHMQAGLQPDMLERIPACIQQHFRLIKL